MVEKRSRTEELEKAVELQEQQKVDALRKETVECLGNKCNRELIRGATQACRYLYINGAKAMQAAAAGVASDWISQVVEALGTHGLPTHDSVVASVMENKVAIFLMAIGVLSVGEPAEIIKELKKQLEGEVSRIMKRDVENRIRELKEKNKDEDADG